MAAATVIATSGATTDFNSLWNGVGRQGDVRAGNDGMVLVTPDISHTVATTNIDDIGDKITLISEAPADSVLLGAYISSTDIDTNASPLLTWKLVVGSTDVVTGLQLGRAAGAVNLSLATGYVTSGAAIHLEVTAAAATGAAGTITARFIFARRART